MKLLVGLGNPGAKYAGHRHNVGFMAMDAIADAHGFGPWRQKFQGLLSEGRFDSDKVLLLKPETFMNLSGQSVGEAMRFFKLDAEDVTVDEIETFEHEAHLLRLTLHHGPQLDARGS